MENYLCEKCGLHHNTQKESINHKIIYDGVLNKDIYPEGTIELQKFDYHRFFENHQQVYIKIRNCINNRTLYIRKSQNIIESITIKEDEYERPINDFYMIMLNIFIYNLDDITELYKISYIREHTDHIGAIILPPC